PRAKTANRNTMHHCDNSSHHHRERRHPEPPGLPDEWKHNELNHGAVSIPNSVAAAGLNTKAITTRRQTGITGGAIGIGFRPFVVQPFESITKVNISKRAKVKCGKFKIQ